MEGGAKLGWWYKEGNRDRDMLVAGVVEEEERECGSREEVWKVRFLF